MTSILMTSVRDDEQAAIQDYAAKHHITIQTTPKLINDALDLVPGNDGVIIQQRGAVSEDVYGVLEANGIKQLTTRTAGVDTIDLHLAHQHSLVVTNVPAYSPRSVAEFALMQIFRMLRHTYAFDHQVAANDFSWHGLQSKEIHSATIGIIGVGRIGGTLAKLLHALNATVLGYDTKPRTDLDGIVRFVSKKELLQQSDVVTLHVNLNPTAEGLIAAEDFKLMKPTAALVNASRGPVVVTKDLVTALQTHQIQAAALDTVEGEAAIFAQDHSQTGIAKQLPLVDELNKMDNVILTPHIAFYTNVAVQNMVDIALDDVLSIINGQAPQNEVR
ncbi:NAD(P)-dependent oxidoreductase [Limosilactobacillus difficilis]|uniref:NAD(P)-dependent oxidoreductase n=1 Tax=Limosilactobacillus difficilis TaxID=2991838 RepID=UPI0024BBB978|nr:NAD(P)-dependent oxidoreductase [Limosilactobacillus difficilis]